MINADRFPLFILTIVLMAFVFGSSPLTAQEKRSPQDGQNRRREPKLVRVSNPISLSTSVTHSTRVNTKPKAAVQQAQSVEPISDSVPQSSLEPAPLAATAYDYLPDHYQFSDFGSIGNRPLFVPGNSWSSAEYLMWWTKPADTPVLGTTSSSTASQAQAGVLGQPTTSILFGADPIGMAAHDGGRFQLGVWLDEASKSLGLQGSFLFLGSNGATYSADSLRYPILAQPFTNAQTGLQDAALVAYPNVQNGQISITMRNEMQIAELTLRHVLSRNPCEEAAFIAGYRYSRLAEGLDLVANTTFMDPAGLIPVGTTMKIEDRFRTENEFQGGEFGFLRKAKNGPLQLDLAAKLGLGNTRSTININGSTVTNTPNQPVVQSIGGLFALPTNIGAFTRNQFSIQPEVNGSLSYRLTSRLRCSVGYSLIYWTQVARPGQLIDTTLNPSQFPPGTLSGPAAPKFTFVTTDFWAQGINFGFAYQF